MHVHVRFLPRFWLVSSLAYLLDNRFARALRALLITRLQIQAVERVAMMQEKAVYAVGGQVTSFIKRSKTTFDDRLLNCVSNGTTRAARALPLICYYVKGLIIWLFALVGFQLASAAIFVSISRGASDDDLAFSEALWHCWVVASTVGYGLVASELPSTPEMHLWSVVHILLGVTLLSGAIGQVVHLSTIRKAKMRRNEIINATMDEALIDALDRDGNGVDRMEYTVGMLTQLGLLSWQDVQPFLDQFDQYDTDRSGRLDRQDLEIMIKGSKQAAIEVVDRQMAGSSPSGAGKPSTNMRRLSNANNE